MTNEIKEAIERAITGAQASVSAGSGGHYSITVSGQAFAGKSPVQQQRMVYSAIAHLMKGDGAPVHAIDKLTIHA